MSIVWETKEGRWSNTLQGYVGKYIAFETFYDGMTSKSDNKTQALRCHLHGIKTNLPNQLTEDAAKVYADKVLEIWLDSSGLTFK